MQCPHQFPLSTIPTYTRDHSSSGLPSLYLSFTSSLPLVRLSLHPSPSGSALPSLSYQAANLSLLLTLWSQAAVLIIGASSPGHALSALPRACRLLLQFLAQETSRWGGIWLGRSGQRIFFIFSGGYRLLFQFLVQETSRWGGKCIWEGLAKGSASYLVVVVKRRTATMKKQNCWGYFLLRDESV